MAEENKTTPNLSEEEKAKQLEKKKRKEEEKAQKLAKLEAKKENERKLLEAKKGKAEEAPKKPVKEKEVEKPYVNTTPAGQKKDLSEPMRNGYEPFAVESAWYDWWLKEGFFTADAKTKKEKFIIVIPPPNVTGSLHLGHGLTNSIQDAITRWHRMSGREALWVPGMDHAGIATQSVVEKKLWKEGKTRHDLGREAFVEKVWEWKEQYGGRIQNQLKKLGSSFDWTRERFTMDEMLSNAVNEAFVRMYEDKIIYREVRLVNWCCQLNTAISDIEVDHKELTGKTLMTVPGHGEKLYEFGSIWDFAYKVDGSSEEIIVSTTRPETMLGDTGVAVHPSDARYQHLIGKLLIHPFVDRKIPVIADGMLVDPEFGTGAVKVTPAHDPNDFACGKRNNLEKINIMKDDGTLNENAGQFAGMKRFDAREAVVKALQEKNLFRGSRDNPMSLGLCSRSKDVIEPILKPQWWVNCQNMAKRAVDAVKNKELEILPPQHEATWFRWLENIQDWCISRQLWWGHRIPAWLITVKGSEKPTGATNDDWTVGRTYEEALENASKRLGKDKSELTLEQDPDVLDTWFSSGLFPFSVFGWPNETEDFKAFFPTSLLETGLDIIFFWVARMVMMGLHLTNRLPFKQVYLHAMVRDAHGKKMSKSLGNVIDPLDMISGITLENLHKQLHEGNLDTKEIERATAAQKADFPEGIPECGTDAMRFALCAYTSQGSNINLDVQRVYAYRTFCNKLWNATKFALSKLGSDFKPQNTQPTEGRTPWEKWILSRLNNAIQLCNDGFRKYEFSQITTAIYNFWLYELCDYYLESLKPILDSKNASDEDKLNQESGKQVLFTCLDNGLRLLSPFMPFVSEELYQRLPKRSTDTYPSICVAPYPTTVDGWTNETAEKNVKLIQDLISSSRKMRSSFNFTKERPKMFFNAHNQETLNVLNQFHQTIPSFTQTSNHEVHLNMAAIPEGCTSDLANESCDVYMLVKGLVNIEDEISKLTKKKEKTQGDYDKLVKTTQTPSYSKVPETKKKENQSKLEMWKKEIETTESTITNFQRFL
eukprot:TRINITY_DN2451_c0_g1_i2.p1 TRINITY_DN2451_c0_g1~~TRINITY_DN2451_c0_g1_i2.p1  ORF type:complete len:1087 (+),score=407.29 TRINITY_DN2451_c0_g1_i2:115-3261(+)